MEIKEMRVIKDGDSWFFVLPDFKDLQSSPVIWASEKNNYELDLMYDDLIYGV